ncbi:MAG: S1/P1 Nuclease, partial [Bacteroidetes bacterium]|nr:S1/P1 Nuclease [Bacteroidota bacterium]
MKPRYKSLLACTVAIATAVTCLSWGRWGHEHINRAAIFALPEEMRVFYYNHADYITTEASVADSRRALLNDKSEPARHFIDLENYLTHPGDSMPQTLKEAIDKHDAKFVDDNGTLPWTIEDLQEKLTRAFRNRNKAELLFLSADLAHYMGDA